jgi:YegS/Rv2252/BmrU family lipid kinase
LEPADWTFVVNPASGRGRGARHVGELVALSRHAGLRIRVELTRGPMHAAELAAAAVRAGCRRIAAVGGDGTANEVANGLAAQDAVPLAQLTMASVPVGTGNDWARTLGMPRDARGIAAALAGEPVLACDLGRIAFGVAAGRSQRLFVNVAGAGFDAFVLKRLGERKPGRWAYTMELLRSMRRFEAPTLVAESPGVARTQASLCVFAGLGRYCGGGMLIAPQARVDDGRIDVTLIGAMSSWQVLVELRRLFDASLHDSAHVQAWSAQSLAIDAQPGTGVEADGELLGETPARIDVMPAALRVVAPALALTP